MMQYDDQSMWHPYLSMQLLAFCATLALLCGSRPCVVLLYFHATLAHATLVLLCHSCTHVQRCLKYQLMLAAQSSERHLQGLGPSLRIACAHEQPTEATPLRSQHQSTPAMPARKRPAASMEAAPTEETAVEVPRAAGFASKIVKMRNLLIYRSSDRCKKARIECACTRHVDVLVDALLHEEALPQEETPFPGISCAWVCMHGGGGPCHFCLLALRQGNRGREGGGRCSFGEVRYVD